MSLYAKYIWSVWKRAKGVNILTVIYMIPFIVAIMFILVTSIFPIFAQYSFIKNSNFNYVYNININTDPEIIEVLRQESLFIVNNKAIRSFEEDYIIDGVKSIIHVCTPNRDLSNTKFTKDNFISFREELKENNIYLSYDSAKALDLEIGDTCAIIFSKFIPNSFKSELQRVEFKVSGILKPNYEDSNPFRSPHNNVSLAVVDDELYNWLIYNNEIIDEELYYIYYSDDQIDFSMYEDYDIDFSYKTKKDLFRDVKDYYTSPSELILKGLNILISIISLFAILLFELRYLRKKHSRNMRIICMLGLSRKGMKKLYMGLSLTNFTIAYIIAFTVFKFLILDFFIEIYHTPLQLLTLSLSILLFSITFTYLQSRKIKVV